MEIDPRFKAARQQAKLRRRNSWLVPLILWGGVGLGVAGLGTGLYFGGILRFGHPTAKEVAENDGVQDEGVVMDAAAAYTSAFIDLPGDPMTLHFDTSGAGDHRKEMPRPAEVPPDRAGGDLVLLTDAMITTEERLITTLPSSREDFAFFNAQRDVKVQAPVAPLSVPAPVLQADATTPVQTEVVAAGEDASWGSDIAGVSSAGQPDTFTRTRIEDTTSVAYIQPEKTRAAAFEDVILRMKEPGDLVQLMVDHGADKAAAERFAEEGKLVVPDIAALVPGHILAFRLTTRAGVKVPVQLSLYTRDSYAGSLGLDDDGHVVEAADPWVDEDLFSFAGEDAVASADIGRKYRLLDAFYSAAIRNGVPSAVVAETIVMLSQSWDMESFAAPGDQMTLLYAPDAGGEGPGPGQVLYAAIKGEGRDLRCHVYRPVGAQDYACFGQGSGGAGAGGGGAMRAGMVTPTAGVMTSRFGPRMHPILHVVKLHKGTDWAAPVGTPVVAAFAGTVNFASDGGTYGNLVKITDADGTETRYAHLSRFADGLKAGQAVAAGQLIGYVGTTGQSTGPHLHFELYAGGQPIDPFAADAVVAAGGAGSPVETMVDQIIRVESGGKADAANPLSTAVGLGQFIESTWIRMMNQYRPDLASTMSRQDLLALRTDPTLSREMVTNLAREGEAYLRNRGHQITAGRLYLCHFLGAGGADVVLSAQDDQLVADVMGAGVVNANPFLKGRTIAYVKEWAELKMSGKGGAVAVAPPLPPDVLAYQKVIEVLLAAT
ncbi:peptidoglycan DD-metalloendopeptidase family protein [Fuscibacter oryzae]|uniref:M23 family metallopeptidase n=1 Tax=Fuscibacter oryzae TaxID=2803939 RepID=A0A8J7MV13_9RHOB|nr:M23 family metallopeptidase [Fuscibacter oryzae]MBL4929590.1 M23 family metallopeptidase [Fuscibacter oryzae]